MTNEVNNIPNVNLLNKSTVFEVNGEEVKLSGNIIKQYLVSGDAEVTDQEVIMFLQLCKYQKLNPFLNEAYLVKFTNKNGKDKPAQIIVSKEAFMKRAETHEQYDGFEAGIIVERNGEVVEIEGAVSLDKDKLLGGWAKVFRKDRSRPVSVRISEKEFNKRQSTWNAMPLTMMRKTAVVNAMREAFPDNLGAMYTEEEQGTTPSIERNVQEEISANANSEVLDMPTQKKEMPKFEEVKEPNELEPEPADMPHEEPPARPY
ncbi:phage recombination protein Bet [Listeria monocytogenes]|uniref:phage recombination protein Bet n=1 Tax=Listeria monocytogenes TaxID=1639 RepID=UPI000BDF4598|nr:phage recombination protein Bet [Listeria monocytogenes]EAC5079610.1 phage recombination protein Bet [Listeria monocytogenes]EAC6159093.1 phage recombination protein Bet [Listeria monocytogenes]EAC7675228.1 phage recombination protein Bet [Listeria monocytogenes]EAC7684185.1 phage recombination protein Bet [Listeria monocytogenes]EAC7838763.1 phage recombination protein Bet [Listeria monocytogenes]